MEMYERICLVRKTLKMNQGTFASAIGFAQSTIAMIEVGKREISDRHIKAICSQFQINEDWLRTGEGSMFVQTKDDYINQLVQRYKGSDLLKKVIEAFINLNDEERKAVLKFIDNLDPEPTESILSGSNLKLKNSRMFRVTPGARTTPPRPANRSRSQKSKPLLRKEQKTTMISDNTLL